MLNTLKDKKWKHLYGDLVSACKCQLTDVWLHFITSQSVKALFIAKHNNLFPPFKAVSLPELDIMKQVMKKHWPNTWTNQVNFWEALQNRRGFCFWNV